MRPKLFSNYSFVCCTLLFGLLVSTYWLYVPGLSGGIQVLDDQHLFPSLKQHAHLTGPSGFLEYLLDQNKSLQARPVSYLTFYWQRASVEEGLFEFKVFNLWLHLCNVALVFFVIIRLFSLTEKHIESTKVKVLFAAAIGAAFWAFSPINVSSVLYATQRMALLVAFFSLAGLLLFLYARVWEVGAKKTLTLFFVVSPLWALGTFSKGNGVLIVLSVLILDATIFRHHAVSRSYHFWRVCTVFAPIALLVMYFVVRADDFFIGSYNYRDFSLYERLVSQPHILASYVSNYLYPFNGYFGVVAPEIELSQGFFDTWKAFFGLCFILILLGLAVVFRKVAPLITIGIFFYLSNHLLESTVVPLELWFEHRNYLPLIGITLIVAHVFLRLFSSLHVGVLGRISLLVFAIVYLGFTYREAFKHTDLWGKPVQQAIYWYSNNETSQRAHSHLSKTLFNSKQFDQLSEFYALTVDDFPDDPSKYLLWAELGCIDVSFWQELQLRKSQEVFLSGHYNPETMHVLAELIGFKERGKCDLVPLLWLHQVVSDFLDNQNYKKAFTALKILKARLYQYQRNYTQAVLLYQEVLGMKWRFDVALSLAEKYIFLGKYTLARELMVDVSKYCEDNLSCRSSHASIEWVQLELARNNQH